MIRTCLSNLHDSMSGVLSFALNVDVPSLSSTIRAESIKFHISDSWNTCDVNGSKLSVSPPYKCVLPILKLFDIVVTLIGQSSI